MTITMGGVMADDIAPEGVDTSVPHSAKVWNYLLLRHEALSTERGERPLPGAVAAA